MKFLIEGARELNKKEQKTINGGKYHCGIGCECPAGWYCVGTYCERLLPSL